VTTTTEGHCLHFARALAAHATGRNHVHPERDQAAAHEIYQSSTMTALLDGVYDGGVTYGELERHGNFGLGTFNALDGEMIAIDGDYFHLHADGSADPVAPDEKTPFAAVTFFHGDARQACTGPINRQSLEKALDNMAPSHNLFAAVRIDGRFERMTTRTVARQTLPYRPLSEATASQTVNTWSDMTGTIAGFRSPDYAQGLSVAGYHFHFISDDRTSGGHVLEFILSEGTLRVDVESGLHLELPLTSAFRDADLTSHDLDGEISAAEFRADT
jgi:acetolactate decarboxylase